MDINLHPLNDNLAEVFPHDLHHCTSSDLFSKRLQQQRQRHLDSPDCCPYSPAIVKQSSHNIAPNPLLQSSDSEVKMNLNVYYWNIPSQEFHLNTNPNGMEGGLAWPYSFGLFWLVHAGGIMVPGQDEPLQKDRDKIGSYQ